MVRCFLWGIVWLPVSLLAQVNLVSVGGLGAGGVYGTVNRTRVAATAQDFSQAVRLQTVSQPAQVYDAGLTLPTAAALAQDDVVAGQVWIRRLAPAGGDAFAVFNFEKAAANYDKSLAVTWVEGSTNWTRFRFAFKSGATYAAGAAHVAVHLGFPPQTISAGLPGE